MEPCKVCGAAKPRVPWIRGLWIVDHKILGVAYVCPCGNNATIPLNEATREEVDRGLLATESTVRAAG
jgi:hypothetical protein